MKFINSERLKDPDVLARILTDLIEFFAYAAIYVTGEVNIWPFAITLIFVSLRLMTSLRFRGLWIVIGFLLQTFLCFLLTTRFQLHPLVAAAYIAPIALSWLGLGRGSDSLWGWRMGLGFIGLILASSLSPDFSVTLFIIAFIVAGAIAVSCRFLAEEFTRRGVQGSLPKGFVRTSFYQSGILFFIALLIFPLIPRMQGHEGGTRDGAGKAGYTEDIDMNEWSRVSSQGSSEAALRIYGPNGEDPTLYIPNGLLRTRVLNMLSETRWDAMAARLDRKYLSEDPEHAALPKLTITREMMGSENLPVPYGTRATHVELSGYRWSAQKTKAGEWREGPSRNQRFNYTVAVSSDESLGQEEQPTLTETSLPEKYKGKRMKALAEKIFKGTKSSKAKIIALASYFRKEGFNAVYAEDAPASKDPTDSDLSPIERFLFVEKNGHCEYFATSYAILLRLAGVPTRLIAGFRVSRGAIGDVLTVRQSDAHAWLEAYLPDQGGWVPLDPTPRIYRMPAIGDWFRDTYDWAGAKWTQYIINYGDGENSLASKWESAKKFADAITSGKNPLKLGDTDTNLYFFITFFVVTSVIFSFVGVLIIRRIRRPKMEFRLDRFRNSVVAEREKFEMLRIRAEVKGTLAPELSKWMELYYPLRFGDYEIPDYNKIEELKNVRKKIKEDLKDTL